MLGSAPALDYRRERVKSRYVARTLRVSLPRKVPRNRDAVTDTVQHKEYRMRKSIAAVLFFRGHPKYT